MAYMTKRVTLSNQTHQCPLSFEVVKEAASQTPAFYDQQGGSKVDRGDRPNASGGGAVGFWTLTQAVLSIGISKWDPQRPLVQRAVIVTLSRQGRK